METVEHGDEDTENNQIPPPPTGCPRPTHPPPTWYPCPSHRPDLEELAQDILNTQSRGRRLSRRKNKTDNILMTMSSIVQDKIREN